MATPRRRRDETRERRDNVSRSMIPRLTSRSARNTAPHVTSGLAPNVVQKKVGSLNKNDPSGSEQLMKSDSQPRSMRQSKSHLQGAESRNKVDPVVVFAKRDGKILKVIEHFHFSVLGREKGI